jgi:hypothetical protein
MEKLKANRDMLHRSLAAFETDCPKETAMIEKARESGFHDEDFHRSDLTQRWTIARPSVRSVSSVYA